MPGDLPPDHADSICSVDVQGQSKRPRQSRRTLKRLPQDIRHQLEQMQVAPELLAKVLFVTF